MIDKLQLPRFNFAGKLGIAISNLKYGDIRTILAASVIKDYMDELDQKFIELTAEIERWESTPE